jgi:formamidopyrimidine-DNA glycosylase
VPELPEVETVRRMLEALVLGRTIARARRSGKRLRTPVASTLPARLRGRRFVAMRRHGKYLLMDLDDGTTLLSHLGMSGRWLFHDAPPARDLPHVHVRIAFADGTELWFQDPRRFGLARLVRSDRLARDPSLAILGPDPIAEAPTGDTLTGVARDLRTSVKAFLLDQRRIAGIGNIYASEILHRAGVDPRRRAGRVTAAEWRAIAAEIRAVLEEAIGRMGTTFSTFRTLWNEPGGYGEQLRVYDRGGEPCRRCGTPIRRIVQAQRSTFYCPRCQGRPPGPPRPKPTRKRTRPAF